MVIGELKRREPERLFMVSMNMTIGDRLTSLHMKKLQFWSENGRDGGS